MPKITALLMLGLLVFACEEQEPASPDSGSPVVDAGVAPEEDAGFPSTCENACRETTLTARIGCCCA